MFLSVWFGILCVVPRNASLTNYPEIESYPNDRGNTVSALDKELVNGLKDVSNEQKLSASDGVWSQEDIGLRSVDGLSRQRKKRGILKQTLQQMRKRFLKKNFEYRRRLLMGAKLIRIEGHTNYWIKHGGMNQYIEDMSPDILYMLRDHPEVKTIYESMNDQGDIITDVIHYVDTY